MAVNRNILSGLINGPGVNGEIIGGFNPNGTKTTKPITFLGGTVLGFNATLGIGPLEESSLTVEILNDCKVASDITNPQGDYFLGEINIGSPVFFDLGEATALEANRADHEAAVEQGKEYFKFGGILQSFTAQQNSGGLTFNARVVDPRSLLGGVVVVVGNTLTGPIKHRNYYNAYAYYEHNVLKPSKREPQPDNGYTLPNTIEQDFPVEILGDPTIVDCSVFGSANSDDRGMLYHRVIEALNNMNPLVYSANYGEEFSPELEGRDRTVALSQNTLKHENNVFRLDLSELPDAPLYYRVPGPNITLLDLINNVCEATGHIFHVVLEKSDNPNKLHTIKIKVADIKNLNNLLVDGFKSEILAYNGRATDLTYGKELTNQNTRTLMIGEQKHEMYETIHIEPFFGEDKYGNPIVPISGDYECGWKIEIYLDDLNNTLRCPLYDYSDDQNPDRKNEVVNRKVVFNEFHIRVAMSSFELWKKYVFNAQNSEDASVLIRRNFPDLTTVFMNNTYYNLMKTRQQVIENEEAQQNANNKPQVTNNAPGKLVPDLLASWNDRMMQAMEKKQSEAIEAVFNYISSLAKTYYGKQYIASISKELCVTDADYVDLNYINASGIQVDKEYTVYDDPCSSDPENKTVISNKLWQPRIYTHIPTNEGAWIEPCGSVLGLGGVTNPSGVVYLDFFRTEDSRVQPVARFDSKVVSTLNRSESLIDDGYIPALNLNPAGAASIYEGVFENGQWAETFIENPDPSALLFASGLCGDLDISNWSIDNYIQIRVVGNCPPPETGINPIDAIDFPSTVWSKCSVGDKIYIDPSGCLRYVDSYYEQVQLINDPCCGKYQIWNPLADCYWLGDAETMPNEDCVQYIQKQSIKTSCSGVVKIPIIFDDPCFTKYCDDANQMEMLAAETELLLVGTSGILESGNSPISYDPYTGDLRTKDGTLIPTTDRFCFKPKPTGISVIASALDFNSTNNQRIVPTAFIPTAVAIPVKSNIETYGPWKSQNFETSSGGIELIQDTDFSPWVFNSVALMNTFAQDVINDKEFNKSEIETGSITYPNFPEKPLGFLANGPNLTNINLTMGSNGVTTTYTYRTYTPKFGGLKTLEKDALKSNIQLIHKIRKLSRDKQRKLDNINKKLRSGGKYKTEPLNHPLDKTGTLQRIIVGETYPFSIITSPNYATVDDGEGGEITIESGYNILGTGDRTVVGTETLQKSIVELRYNYEKKAFMSWDGLLSPISISGDGDFPMYARYSGFEYGASGIYNAPNPPVIVSGVNVNNISIDRSYLNPLTNNFGDNQHHHLGSGAGHNIDVVGRGITAPESGILMNAYTQNAWDKRYSEDYRFLGLRGPLVLHSWGYDTQGKPIPNAIDDPDLIKGSGIFRTEDASGSGLQDYFLQDWLHKPSAWPVAPVDLRFDRQRGMWVSPPDYKMVVVEPEEAISSYGSGTGVLINEYEGRKYNQDIYDGSGNLVHASGDLNEAKIVIEDRIGRNISPGEKSYAYFDSFTSTYLLMGAGGSSVKIGKFCNQWPSLSNVKDPKNAVKKVVLYEPSNEGCGDEPCPWNLQPVMVKVSGVDVPSVVEAINLFSNVAAAEYQTKWCAITQNGDNYYLLAAEC